MPVRRVPLEVSRVEAAETRTALVMQIGHYKRAMEGASAAGRATIWRRAKHLKAVMARLDALDL